MIPIQEVMRALFRRLQDRVSAVGPTSFSRRPLSQNNLPPLPCLELRVLSFTAEQQRGVPTKWLIKAEVVIRAQAASAELADSPEDAVFDIVREVADALATQDDEPGDGSFTTLNGLVDRCWVTRAIDIHDSTISSDLAAATVPVEILLHEK